MNIYIERWRGDLGEFNYLSVADGGFQPIAECSSISGWYAEYREGNFAYWIQGECQYIKWKNQTVALDESSQLKWSSGISGREFSVYEDQKLTLNACYRRLVFRPWALITDLIVPDDDWGLEYDLPSFVHSHFANGGLFEMVSKWNQRNES